MEQEPVRFDAIFEWRMTSAEADAYRIAVLYEQEYLKNFGRSHDLGTRRRNTISLKGDPRKTNLFRFCWKLRRETRGLVREDQWPQYIQAQMVILKIKNARHVEPNSICGDKAWVRWKVYERLWNIKQADLGRTTPPPNINTTDPKIIGELRLSKKFLFERCNGEPTPEKIKDFADNGFLKLWIMTGKISKFYLCESPWVQQAVKDFEKFAEECSFDPSLFKSKMTEEVKEYIRHEYSHEFVQTVA